METNGNQQTAQKKKQTVSLIKKRVNDIQTTKEVQNTTQHNTQHMRYMNSEHSTQTEKQTHVNVYNTLYNLQSAHIHIHIAEMTVMRTVFCSV